MAALIHSINLARRQISVDFDLDHLEFPEIRTVFDELADIINGIKYTGLAFLILFGILVVANATTLVLLKKGKKAITPIILVFFSAALYTIYYGIMWRIKHMSRTADRAAAVSKILGDVFLLNALHWTTFIFSWVFFGINAFLLIAIGVVRTWIFDARGISATAVHAFQVLPSIAVLLVTGLLEFYAFKAHKQWALKNKWTNWLRLFIGPMLILAAAAMVALSIAYVMTSPDPESSLRDGEIQIVPVRELLTPLRITEGQLIAWGAPTAAAIVAFLVYMWKFYPKEE